ncbi:uncharacterized protein LOC122849430 [Aphidius gifuensis]|uniref:uncharacterized protein LOC122849430 n=1 Tax=Aphidius gifuensis TaxID=684658 RepID=UPI001CDBCBFD|nr:uncharacterized protein LOC122849430 [Aphidius gifuensis]
MKIKKPKKNSPAKESVTFKDKVKIVKLMFDNPSLKIEEIKELSGCDVLENFSQIYKWANQVDTQGSFKSIMGVINESVYQKYNDNINIINKNNIDGLLYKWGMEAKKSFFPNRDINFKAGKDWIKNFKFANKININTDPPKQLTRSVDMVLRVKRLREEEDDDDDDDEVAIIKERKKTGNKKIKRRTLPSFEDKQKIVKLSNENPDWSIDTLIKMCGVDCVIDEEKIEKWKKELKKGGSLRDKHKLLNSWVLAKFDEHRKNMIPVNFEMIKDWGDEGRKELNIPKLASNESTWVNRFKNKNQVFGDDNDLQRKP